MPRLLDTIMFIITFLACIGVDFVVMKYDRQENDLTVAAYIAQRKSDFDEFLNPPELVDLLPSQLPGWQVMKRQSDEPVLIAGGDAAAQQNPITLLKTISHIRRLTMPKGEIIQLAMAQPGVVLHMGVFLDAPSDATLLQASPELSEGEQALEQFLQAPPPAEPPPAMVKGMALLELPVDTMLNDPDLRLFRADVGAGLTLYITTKTKDTRAIQAALELFDIARLRRLYPPTAPKAAAPAPEPELITGAQPEAEKEPDAFDLLKTPEPAFNLNLIAPAGAEPEPVPELVPQEPAAQAEEEAPAKPSKPCMRKAGVLVCPEE